MNVLNRAWISSYQIFILINTNKRITYLPMYHSVVDDGRKLSLLQCMMIKRETVVVREVYKYRVPVRSTYK